MSAVSMSASAAVGWGSFVAAAYDQYAHDPGQDNPSSIVNMPAGYTLVRTIQMSDFLGSNRDRVFYGFVAVGGDPQAAVVAVRGTASVVEWWDDMHWRLVPFTPVSDGGQVAEGFFDIYRTFGTMTPAATTPSRPSGSFAAEIADAIAKLGRRPGPRGADDRVRAQPGRCARHAARGRSCREHPVRPQVWTFASPRVGDATFAARYGALSGVSWRIYNQVDVVPYFPVDTTDHYQPVTTGYAISSLGRARWSLGCAHALNTYMHVLAPITVPLRAGCAPTS